MRNYFLKRIFNLILTFFGITLISFLVTQMAPGDPVDFQSQMNPKLSLEAKQELLKRYGLDQPVLKRYGDWLVGILTLDFGHSFRDGESVTNKIASRIPITIFISIASLFLTLLIAIPLGMVSAIRENTFWDHLITAFVLIGFSIPTFWLALVLMSFFGVHWHLLPVSGIHSLDYEYMNLFEKTMDLSKHLVLPITLSAFTGLAGISRFTRTSMIEVLNQEYIKTAWSKGLSPRTVYWKHAFKNAILPIVTILGLSIPSLLGGSVIFETIFSIPGMGKLMYDSVMARDMPVYMAILVLGTFLTLLGNFIADITYKWADPRIRYQ